MKKITILLFVFLSSLTSIFANQGGVLTSTPTPIVPNQTVTINYDGTGTNFATWTPMCYIHAWLNPISGQTFSQSYSTPWVNCAGDMAYDALDAKLKMTHVGAANSGQYTITIPDLTAFFSVAAGDVSKIASLGIIVKTQWSTNGASDQTNDLLLAVGSAAVASDKFNFAYGIANQSGWTFLDLTKNANNPDQYEVFTTLPDLTGLSCYVGWNSGGIGNPTWTNTGGGHSNTVLMTSISSMKSGQVWIVINKSSTADNWGVNVPLNTSTIEPNKNEITISEQNGLIKARFSGIAQVELFNATGKLISSTSATNEFTQSVTNGIYLLRINGQTHKVLVR